MPIHVKKLNDRTLSVAFTYMGETMEVEYRPNAITRTDFFEELKQFEDVDQSLVFQLQAAVARWELLDDAGKPEEITLELVKSIERPFWFALIEAINQDMERRIAAKNP
jgi:hypothetical protein